ncbi:molybdopterin molybdenumtransferase MoeA [Chloroflexi bacterium TSY]|nr:molybdopterin molybdenumtransferase MoeA [Chloroflexi bacterium TSY]
MTESPYLMLSVEDALKTVLVQAQPLPSQLVELSTASGMILAQDVVAGEPLPPFPASMKDGYAVVAADGPGDYPVVGEVTAGYVADFAVNPGEIAYITTGAPIPTGADAVVMVEDSEPSSDVDGRKHIRIKTAVDVGDDIRPIGIDVAAGQRVLAAGDYLGATEIGLLATVGATNVSVYRRPKIAVLSTGDELVEPSAEMGPGQIRDSNRSTLRAAIRAVGGDEIDLGIVRDSQGQLDERVNHGLRAADILVTSGGVSMGELDLLKPLLEQTGRVHFGRIRMKPGKPLTFATTQIGGRRRLVFALPGNPVSSLVTFYLFTVPAMRKMAGWPNPHLPRIQAQLTHSLRLDPVRPEYHRATVKWEPSLHEGRGGFVAVSTGSQTSSRLLSMRTANALLELPQQEGEMTAGSMVSALLIGELGI